MVRADGARRLPPGLVWLGLLFALGLGVAGLLGSMAATDLQGKLTASAAAAERRAQIERLDAMVLATADAQPAAPAAITDYLRALHWIEAEAAALRRAASPSERPRADRLAFLIADFIQLRRELAALAQERGPDDARLLAGSEAVRLNRLSLARELEAVSAAADRQVTRTAATLAEARQHWLSVMVALLAAVVLLAFLQVVRLARRPVQRAAEPFPALLDTSGPRSVPKAG